MRKLVGFCIVLIAAILVWHIFIWSKIPSNASIDVNPLTDVAHIRISGASQMGFTDPSSISAFNGVRDLVGGTIGERELGNYAREYFDIYAMILPYHIIISDEQAPKAVTASSEPAPIVQKPRPGEYVNERFGFSFQPPAGFTAGPSPENGDGVHMTSKDGTAAISAWGSNLSGSSLRERYDDYLKEIGAEPSYSHIGNNWFVLSWAKDGKISYVKMFVGPASENAFIFEYPEEDADIYKTVNTQLERSFRPGDISQSW
jgi:hypothetical protein